jgi:hypothetical protein
MSVDNERPRDGEVGYGKPPKHTRFKKGVSGNPAGRPRGKRNFATMLNSALSERVGIAESGVRKTITKIEAVFKQLVNKAASGDLHAIRQLTHLVRAAEDGNIVPRNRSDDSEADKKVVATFLERLQRSTKGE